ncbi:hypothetical protein OPV22_031721 [Ensete ventricosum]|uniref:Uncharacterized protein n=1 Tax=Ensete ventricosum TaxID=4639 RepID=A0AAV8PMZ1_ENSVE|nr:hypothetical protein OPV22_031721 [Ensete ventricosum]
MDNHVVTSRWNLDLDLLENGIAKCMGPSLHTRYVSGMATFDPSDSGTGTGVPCTIAREGEFRAVRLMTHVGAEFSGLSLGSIQ